VVITSARVEGQDCVLVYDHKSSESFRLNFEMVDVRFPGTGDIFSGVLIGDVLDGRCLRDAAEHAMTVVRRIILDNLQKPDKFAGVDVERFISEGKL